MEGKVENDERQKGFFYENHIDNVPFFYYLEKALDENHEYFEVVVDKTGTKNHVIRRVKANPHLIELYAFKAKDLQMKSKFNLVLEKANNELDTNTLKEDKFVKNSETKQTTIEPLNAEKVKAENNINNQNIMSKTNEIKINAVNNVNLKQNDFESLPETDNKTENIDNKIFLQTNVSDIENAKNHINENFNNLSTLNEDKNMYLTSQNDVKESKNLLIETAVPLFQNKEIVSSTLPLPIGKKNLKNANAESEQQVRETKNINRNQEIPKPILTTTPSNLQENLKNANFESDQRVKETKNINKNQENPKPILTTTPSNLQENLNNLNVKIDYQKNETINVNKNHKISESILTTTLSFNTLENLKNLNSESQQHVKETTNLNKNQEIPEPILTTTPSNLQENLKNANSESDQRVKETTNLNKNQEIPELILTTTPSNLQENLKNANFESDQQVKETKNINRNQEIPKPILTTTPSNLQENLKNLNFESEKHIEEKNINQKNKNIISTNLKNNLDKNLNNNNLESNTNNLNTEKIQNKEFVPSIENTKITNLENTLNEKQLNKINNLKVQKDISNEEFSKVDFNNFTSTETINVIKDSSNNFEQIVTTTPTLKLKNSMEDLTKSNIDSKTILQNNELRIEQNQKNYFNEQDSLHKKDVLLDAQQKKINVENEKNTDGNLVYNKQNDNQNLNNIPLDPIIKSITAKKSINFDKEDYCQESTCLSFENKMDNNKLKNFDNKHLNSIRVYINDYVKTAKLFLPYPINNFDNTGILILLFLIISIILHFINDFLSNGKMQQDVIDKRLLHDCLTRLKEQDIELQNSKINADSAHLLGEARSHIANIESENSQISQKLSEFHEENTKLKSINELIEREMQQKERQLSDLQLMFELKERENKALNEQISNLSTRVNNLSDDLKTAKKDLDGKRREFEVLQSDHNDLKLEKQKLEVQLTATEKELVIQKTENVKLQNKVDEFLLIIREQHINSKSKNKLLKDSLSNRNNKKKSIDSLSNVIDDEIKNSDSNNLPDQDDNGVGSGGSVGWSDLSEADIADRKLTDETELDETNKNKDLKILATNKDCLDREKETQKIRANLFEIAELKSNIRKLEIERDSLRFTLESEQKEKESLLQRLEQVKQDLAEKRRDAELREADRHELQSQCQKMLHMVEERDRKLQSSEEERDRLRNKISDTEIRLRKEEDEKRELNHKVRELEHSLRKMEEQNSKLETKLYHEERRLTAKICQLEENYSKLNSLSPNKNIGNMNLSGNSSDRDFEPRVSSEFPRLWSDVDSDSQYDALCELDRRNLTNNSNSLRRRSVRSSLHCLTNRSSINEPSSRSSPFEMEEYFSNRTNSIKDKRNNTVNYRARSRSTGRPVSGRQSAKLVGVVPSNLPNSTPMFLRK